jgi:UPF0716 family protein affecting phage T7 exclusion
MTLILRWLTAFGRFWYDFIIGDDWTVAATVALGLIGTWLLRDAGVSAWWLLPAAVTVVVGLSLQRTAGHR